MNSIPVDDFFGYSANDMHYFLYEPFSDRAPVQLRDDIDNATFDRIPFFRMCEEFLKIIQKEKAIQLTPRGALKKKVMVDLYNYRFIPDELIEEGICKLSREEDCISIQTVRFVTEIAGLVKKRKGRLSLTKNGTLLLKPENRLPLFKSILAHFAVRFNWGVNDGYPVVPIIQMGWTFSIFIVDRFGDQPHLADFYAEKFAKAFPLIIDEFENSYYTPLRQFSRCYGIRFLYRFLYWLGMVNINRKGKWLDLDKDTIAKSDLLGQLFMIEQP